MDAITIRDKLVEEINHLSENQLQQLLNVIHSFPSDHLISHEHNEGIHEYAGCWKDMPDEVYEDFISEIYERRKNVDIEKAKRLRDPIFQLASNQESGSHDIAENHDKYLYD